MGLIWLKSTCWQVINPPVSFWRPEGRTYIPAFFWVSRGCSYFLAFYSQSQQSHHSNLSFCDSVPISDPLSSPFHLQRQGWLHWSYLDTPGYIPILGSLITSSNSLCKVTYSPIPGIRTWASLGFYHSFLPAPNTVSQLIGWKVNTRQSSTRLPPLTAGYKHQWCPCSMAHVWSQILILISDFFFSMIKWCTFFKNKINLGSSITSCNTNKISNGIIITRRLFGGKKKKKNGLNLPL